MIRAAGTSDSILTIENEFPTRSRLARHGRPQYSGILAELLLLAVG